VARASVTPRGRTFAWGCALGLVALSWGYGLVRSRAEFTAGPRIGLLQGSFLSSVQPEPGVEDDIFRTYRNLNGLAVQHQAELIVWPESMMPYVMLDAPESLTDKQLAALHPVIPVERWKDRTVQKVLTSMAEESKASLIVGAGTFIGTAGQDHSKRYNSAIFIQPTGIQGRYDKIHRVPFGEYIPLKDDLPFLHTFTPYAEGFGIDAGQTVGVFRHKNYRLLPLICFEDTVPHLVRSAVEVSRSSDEKSPGDVDCLVNLSNDGWFHGSSEHDQHLITASFRCIETRVPMIRAANTGVSAIIDGNGQIRDPEVLIDFDLMKARKPYERTTLIDPATGTLPKLTTMVQVGHIPLDPRESLYVKWGDWFAISCLCFTLFAVLYGAFTGRGGITPEPTPALG
jgi:apolipoprotein N-acyltransferase